MLFNSFQFAVFLPVVFFLYWAIPHRLRWGLLLIASYYFYMSWDARYILLILFTTVVSYSAALLIGRTNSDECGLSEARNVMRKRTVALIGALVACSGVLFFFKYYNWLSGDLVNALNALAIPVSMPALQILLPVGISFYTFQTLSYVIDVYKGKLNPERHFGYYAVYIAFFPQLVAGPIERAENILPQLREERCFNRRQTSLGAQRMAWGYFKKIVIADTLAKGVDVVYGDVSSFTGLILVIATIMFAIQIYCDFSGYSDIAIGSAQLMGIDLMMNFNSPYYSSSIKEFWSRWHISLSTWFRDYVYIPLGGNRCSVLRRDFNLLATFLVSGLWHGANWTFLAWGGVHGIGQIVENHLSKKHIVKGDFGRAGKAFRIALTFGFVCFAWVFFRVETLSDAGYIFMHAFVGADAPIEYFSAVMAYGNIDPFGVMLIIAELLFLAVIDWLRMSYDLGDRLLNAKPFIRYVVYVVFLLMVALLSVKGTSAEFIYFQF